MKISPQEIEPFDRIEVKEPANGQSLRCKIKQSYHQATLNTSKKNIWAC
jgi:hypothetical protein